MALPEPDPADARRQSLKLNPRARHVEPAVQMRIVRNQFPHFRIGLVNILGFAGERGPAEWPNSAAEQRADILRHETGDIEGARDARVEGDLANVVAVVEHRQP